MRSQAPGKKAWTQINRRYLYQITKDSTCHYLESGQLFLHGEFIILVLNRQNRLG